MAGQISQVDLEAQDPDTLPSRFVQLRFPTGEIPGGNIYFYDSKNTNETVLVLSATIIVSPTTATDTFTVDGFDYYTYEVNTDILQGNPQNFGIVYADASGTVQSTVIFGENDNPGDVEFDGGPLDEQTVGSVIDGGSVEGGGFQSGNGPFAISPDGDVTTTPDPDPEAPCFTAGTLIATPGGPVAVEQIAVGDLVLTIDGRAVPILFAGYTTVAARFSRSASGSPVLIRAGAFAEDIPCQDLLVSPHHGMILDDTLIFAQALVNGVSIVEAPPPAPVFRYFHIETERHEIILANGAPAETFCDNVSREAFDNHADFLALFPDGRDTGEMDLPHAMSRRQVPRSILARLDVRARAIAGVPERDVA